ncbi:MAG TPA: VTT domain-containing protein [Syntrophomonadaceae bacterium]|nr:VTT domain-containing protein [Syntrophomonadaceae bacterium]
MARIIPIVPTPLINIVAALSRVRFSTFFFSSAIGKIPTAVLYTGLGIFLFNSSDIKLTLFIISIILILAILGRYMAKKNIHLIGR